MLPFRILNPFFTKKFPDSIGLTRFFTKKAPIEVKTKIHNLLIINYLIAKNETVTPLCGLPSCYSFYVRQRRTKISNNQALPCCFFLESKIPNSFFCDGYRFQRKSIIGKTVRIKCAAVLFEKDTIISNSFLLL